MGPSSEAPLAAFDGNDPAGQSVASPNVLLAATTQWATGARLAISLSVAGCKVSAVCLSRGQPLLKTRAVRQVFPYSGLRPLQSLSEAIEASRPQFIVPCDDRAVQHLHELHKSASDGKIAALIERSLGPPHSYPIVSGRYTLLKFAHEEGLRAPKTCLVNSMDDLAAWHGSEAFPWVLKADNTFAGSGVKIAYSLAQAQQYFLELSSLCGTKNVFKRLFVDRDAFGLRPWWSRSQPAIVIQPFIQGIPANCVVVCWEGRILAGIGVEVLLTQGPTKPAIIVRVVKNCEMMLAAERIAGRLGLSGFFGLDFIIDRSGAAYLIEMNPRCAPPCHLQLGSGRDLVAALSAQLSGQPMREFPAVTNNEIIAYFPNAWHSQSELLKSSFHDMPQGEPILVEELLRPSAQRPLLSRVARYWRSKTRPAKSTPPPGSVVEKTGPA